MFGKNPIRVQDLSKPDALHVETVWLTLQGEGPLAGVPAVFVRLSGCWLACYWCDTQFEEGMARDPWPVLKVVQEVEKARQSTPTSLVVLTGGDPLRQNILPLCNALILRRYHVQLETAGIRWVPGLQNLIVPPNAGTPGVSVVCSPKTGKVAQEVLAHACAWKYIVRKQDEIGLDGLPMSSTQTKGFKQTLQRPPVSLPRHQIYLQPCDEQDERKNRDNMEFVSAVAMRCGYRVSLQTHKIIGVD